jgi:hypothetical protein
MNNIRKINVLGFDGWTQGIHHYTRLLSTFNNYNINLKVIHYGSWGEDVGRPKEEIIDGLLVRDISYYNTFSFNYILDYENPDIVIFLSTETFLHRAFQRYCQKKKIPTIHLFHGLLGVVPFQVGKNAYSVNVYSQIKYLFKMGGKFLKYTFYIYIKSLYETNATINDWIKFITDLSNRVIGKFVIIPALDSKATRCCVYTNADLKIVDLKWQYKIGEVLSVGNPDLARFGLEEKLLGSSLNRDNPPECNIIYIDSGISSHGLNFSSDQEYINYLLECAEILREKGFNLFVKVKPHPTSRYYFICGQLRNKGISILENNSFLSVLSNSSGCIIEPSTASLIPCLLGMPVFLTQVGPLHSLLYGDLFLNYPRGLILKNWHDFQSGFNLKIEENIINRTKEWITDNVGPLPSSEMPQRVAKLIIEVHSVKN